MMPSITYVTVFIHRFIIPVLPLTVSPRASCLTFLNLSLLICERMMIIAISKFLEVKVKLRKACKVLNTALEHCI